MGIVHNANSHESAQQYCMAEGMELAKIDSLEENNYLKADDHGFWIGGVRDTSDPAKWKWGHDGVAWAAHGDNDGVYRNWASGQPGDEFGEDCIMNSGGEWHDYPCSPTFW